MAITDQEKEEIKTLVVNEITTMSISIDELTTTTDLNVVESFPAYKKNSDDLVKVSVASLSEASEKAATTANSAAAYAERASQSAEVATANANKATTDANAATALANSISETLKESLDDIDSIKSTANKAAVKADSNESKINSQLGTLSIKVLTEEEYEDLEVKDDNTLYFIKEDED
jgi:hypothetical protein